MKTLVINTDGGARGNPGPAAVGMVFQLDKWKANHEKYIGVATNNVAEYMAVREALQYLLNLATSQDLSIDEVKFYLDSELVVRQLQGKYKVKEPALQRLHQEIQQTLEKMDWPVSFEHVPRAQNRQADKLVNHALDQHLKT